MKRAGWIVKGAKYTFFIDPINDRVYVYLGVWVTVCCGIKHFCVDGYRIYRGYAKGGFI